MLTKHTIMTSGKENNTNNPLESLDERTLEILCFLAYHGEDTKIESGAEYRKYVKVSKSAYDAAIDELNRLGFIQGKSYIKRCWHIQILRELYVNHPQWIDTFKQIHSFSRNNVAEYLCNVVKLITAGNYTKAAKLKRPYMGLGYKQFNLLKYMNFSSIEDIRFIKMMNDYEVRDMVHELLETSFRKDELTIETLTMLRQLVGENNMFRDDLLGEISAFEFFISGSCPGQDGNRTLWSEAIRGVKLMYEGKMQESVESFDEALLIHSKKAKAFENAIFNYVYGIALYKTSKRGISSENKLNTFLGDKNVRFKEDSVCIRQLIECIEGKRSVSYSVSNSEDKMLNSFIFILDNFLGKKGNDISTEQLHSAAILQYEMSNKLALGHDVKCRLKEIFLGEPLITRLNKRPSWEIAFKEIEDCVSHVTKKEKRIAYYVNGFDLEAIIEQTMEDDGWHDGQVLSLTTMKENGYDSMDGKDTIIASSLTKNFDGAAKIIIPILADTDRIYHGSYYDGTRHNVNIKKVKPYLSFESNGDAIAVNTNVETDCNGNVQKHTLRNTIAGEYLLITVNPFQKEIINKFLKIGSVPSTAVISLRRAIESLNGIIDVNDSALKAFVRPTAMSRGLLAVRIIPRNNEYNISILASAMENGTARFSPAEGETVAYDEVDNITHCINRDLKKEFENYTLLQNYLECGLRNQFTSYAETVIYELESLLNLIAFVYDNQDRFFVEWPEGKPLRFRGDVKSGDIDVAIGSTQEWFTLEGQVTTSCLRMSLEALVRSCCGKNIKGFVKISDDEYIRMSEELKHQIAALEDLSTQHCKKKVVSKYHVGALASMIHNLRVNEDGGYTAFMQRTKQAYAINPDIPTGLNVQLREYQKEGFRWMCRLSAWGAGACLADDMGLGKTIQAITFLLHKANEGASLVVAPKSVLMNWESEINRFAPALHCININTDKCRNEAIASAKEMDVVLCSYGVFVSESLLLTKKKWNVVCLDEAHTIKNRNTIASHTSMDLFAKNRIILTGTPLQNNLGELWNLFQFINPGLLGTWSNFRSSFIMPSLDNEHSELLKEMTRPFILRRTKQEVLSELPEKLISKKFIDLTEKEQMVYEEMRRRAEIKFKNHKNSAERDLAKTIDINFFTELTHLREASCSMRLVFDEWTERSSKIDALMDILRNILPNEDNNIVVFSQFTSFLELIKPELKRENMPFLYLDGQTPLVKRKEYVEEFQEGRCRLFLSSLKAGGVGINLTKANYVILLDPWWNPSVENQAMDRAHRIGQKRVVTVIRLICTQTIEEKILNLHEDKQRLTDDILEGTKESHKLTYEDVMDLVSPF